MDKDEKRGKVEEKSGKAGNGRGALGN